MELKRCPRCGNFYNSDLNVCQDCKTNENLDVSKLKGYIDQYGMNASTEEMAINTGVNEPPVTTVNITAPINAKPPINHFSQSGRFPELSISLTGSFKQ